MERSLVIGNLQLTQAYIFCQPEDLLQILSSKLKHLGLNITECSSKSSFVNKICNNQGVGFISVGCFTSGEEAFSYIKSLRKEFRCKTPIVIIGRNRYERWLDELVNLKNVTYLSTPIRKEELTGAIHFAIHKEKILSDVIEMVESKVGLQYNARASSVLLNRVKRRTIQLQISNIFSYFHYLLINKQHEIAKLVNAFTNNTTLFFRESHHFHVLENKIFPLCQQNKQIRILSAGCSSGEELYSIAISFLEYCRNHNHHLHEFHTIEFIGIDYSLEAIAEARRGIYQVHAVRRVQNYIVDKYFDVGKDDLSGLIRVKDSLYKFCHFERANLLEPLSLNPPFDAIFCRNVFIYFNNEKITRVCHQFIKLLNPLGFLFLGHSETLTGLGLPFKSIDHAVYQVAPKENLTNSIFEQPEARVSERKINVYLVADKLSDLSLLRTLLSSYNSINISSESLEFPDEKEAYERYGARLVIYIADSFPGKTQHYRYTYLPCLVVLRSQIEGNEIAVGVLQKADSKKFRVIELTQILNQSSAGSSFLQIVLDLVSNYDPRLHNFDSLQIQAPKTKCPYDLIAIGASTGGVNAIETLLSTFPVDTPPIVIVQHIPEKFSAIFAGRLNLICRIAVSEAKDGEFLQEGHAYVAPGNSHMTIKKIGSRFRILLSNEEKVNGHRPSVDFLFSSLVGIAQKHKLVAVLLTGMGKDGAQGMKELFDAGVHTIAESKDSAVVNGMPEQARALGAVKESLSLAEIANALFRS